MALVTAKIDLVRPTSGARFHRVTLECQGGGALVVRSLKASQTAEPAWGFDDEELALSIAPEDLPRLAMALASALLMARPDAVERFKSICENHEIPIHTTRWT
jgi:hypothetical protein